MIAWLGFLSLLEGGLAVAGTLYVWPQSPDPAPPYAAWNTAAHTIQDAVALAVSGDTVLVTNGVYGTGGRAVHGAMTNRVAIDKPIVVRSVNGPQGTLIVGVQAPSGDGPGGAVRGAYVTSNGVLAGFTVTNGYSLPGGDLAREQSGGGVWCDASGVVSNCVLVGNSAAYYGGGAYQGILLGCTITGNTAGQWGGGVAWSKLFNCTLSDNLAGREGGGACRGELYNCTITCNEAVRAGGGAFLCVLTNCIIFYNTALNGSNCHGSSVNYSCTTPLPPDGYGNVQSEPAFVDLTAGDFRLSQGSPCIDAGNYQDLLTTFDLAGNPRVLDGNGDGVAVGDMGAYEFDLRTVVPTNWFRRYGLNPDDPHVVAGDPDGDACTTFQEWLADTDPTNSASFFHIAGITDLPPISVSFPSSSNRTYSLVYVTNVADWLWTEVPGQFEVRGTGGLTTLSDTKGGRERFYRVRVRIP